MNPVTTPTFIGLSYGAALNMVASWSALYHAIGTASVASSRASVLTSHSTLRVVIIWRAASPIALFVNGTKSGAGTIMRPPQNLQQGTSCGIGPFGQQPGSVTAAP